MRFGVVICLFIVLVVIVESNNLKKILESLRYHVYVTPYEKLIKSVQASKGTYIKVLSYNILAVCLLESNLDMYHEHDQRYLDWVHRSKVLIQEINDFDADIICLQELEANKLDFFNDHLEHMGYTGTYKKRTSDRKDGCGIYYRKNKFNLKELVSVEYYQSNFSLLNRDNIGLIMRLAPKDNLEKDLVIATTHLVFNLKRHDIKLAQMQMLLAEIERVAFKNFEDGCTLYHPIILAGDFNLKPFTHVYNLLSNGWMDLGKMRTISPDLGITNYCQHRKLILNRRQSRTDSSDFKYVQISNSDYQSSQWQKNSNEKESSTTSPDKNGSNYLYYKLNLSDVHPQEPNSTTRKWYIKSSTPTTWSNVDYIFYGPTWIESRRRPDGDLKLVSYLRVPSKKEKITYGTLPNEICGSDHFPLLATFYLRY